MTVGVQPDVQSGPHQPDAEWSSLSPCVQSQSIPDKLWVHLILVSHDLESGHHVASHPIRLQTQHAHLSEVGDHPQCPLLDSLPGD